MVVDAPLRTITLSGAGPVLDLAVDTHGDVWAVDGSQLYRLPGGSDELAPLAQLPGDSAATAVAATQAGVVIVGLVGGIAVSPDRGASWSVRPFREPSSAVIAVEVVGSTGVILAATLSDGVLRSDDGAATWTPWNFGLFDRQLVSLATSVAGEPPTVFAATESGCFRSANTGKSWRDLDAPPTDDYTAVACIDSRVVVSQDNGRLLSWSETSGWRELPDILGMESIVSMQGMCDGRIVLVNDVGRVIVLDRTGSTLTDQVVPIPSLAAVVSLFVRDTPEGATRLTLGLSNGDVVLDHLMTMESDS